MSEVNAAGFWRVQTPCPLLTPLRPKYQENQNENCINLQRYKDHGAPPAPNVFGSPRII